MSVLYFLESIRCPFLDGFFSFITHFGEETLYIFLVVLFFWCIDKKQGYYLLSIGFIGLVVNQFLKMYFRIPRPWVRDPSFTIVESARAEATGYSFPSGHTQASVGGFGAIARAYKNAFLRLASIALCVLVPLSRLYLGVHTPLDVGVSIIIAVALTFGLYPIISKCFQNKRVMRGLFSAMAMLSLGLLAFLLFYGFPADVDAVNLKDATENAYKMVGCTVGLYIVYEVDERLIGFNTRASLPVQIIKCVGGMIPVLLIKEGLKAPLAVLFGGNEAADGVRYFLIVIFIGCVWPLTFGRLGKIFKKKGE